MGLFRVRRNGAECLRRRVSNAPEARCGLRSRIRRSAGHIFSLLREKIWKKRALERFYSAYAPEKACRSVLRVVVSFPSSKRPSGGPQNFCCLKFRCGKYLCLQKRKASVQNSRGDFLVLPVSPPQSLLVAEARRAKHKVKGQRLRREALFRVPSVSFLHTFF